MKQKQLHFYAHFATLLKLSLLLPFRPKAFNLNSKFKGIPKTHRFVRSPKEEHRRRQAEDSPTISSPMKIWRPDSSR